MQLSLLLQGYTLLSPKQYTLYTESQMMFALIELVATMNVINTEEHAHW